VLPIVVLFSLCANIATAANATAVRDAVRKFGDSKDVQQTHAINARRGVDLHTSGGSEPIAKSVPRLW